MLDDIKLRDKLDRLEALFRRASSSGEKAAAGAAMKRLQQRLKSHRVDPDPEIEYHCTFPDTWTSRLFRAVCRKHGLKPYRYRRQRYTTVMVRVREKVIDDEIWPEYEELRDELQSYFEDVTNHLITRAMRSSGEDQLLDR